MKTNDGYTGVQIGLPWLISVLIQVDWKTGEGAEEEMD